MPLIRPGLDEEHIRWNPASRSLTLREAGSSRQVTTVGRETRPTIHHLIEKSYLPGMTAEEEAARQYGSALSVARYIYETRRLPSVGQSWKVDAAVLNYRNEDIRPPEIQEFSFEVVITPEILDMANAMAREFATSKRPRMWLTGTADKLAILLNNDQKRDALRTTAADLEHLVQSLKRSQTRVLSDPQERWLLNYLAAYWNPCIPANESKDYYRGEAHAFRITLDAFQIMFPGNEEIRRAPAGSCSRIPGGTQRRILFRASLGGHSPKLNECA
jgi:hypothetical protein